MATIEIERGSPTVDMAALSSLSVRRILIPAVRWGAVLAGVAVGISVQLVLSMLGLAAGLSSIDVTQSMSINPIASMVWGTISLLIAALVGSYVAARLSGLKRKVDGILHGAVTWAVTILLIASFATSVTSALMGGLFTNTVTGMAQGTSSEFAITSLLRTQTGGGLDSLTMQQLLREIQAGRRQEAVSLLANSSGIDNEHASRIIDQAINLSVASEKSAQANRTAVSRAIDTASTTAWMVFFATALSLACSLVGGALGSAAARRKLWTSSEASSAERES